MDGEVVVDHIAHMIRRWEWESAQKESIIAFMRRQPSNKRCQNKLIIIALFPELLFGTKIINWFKFVCYTTGRRHHRTAKAPYDDTWRAAKLTCPQQLVWL